MISEKFKNIPVEEDTKILERQEMKIADYDVIYEKWFYEGIRAESYIFCNKDIERLSKKDVLMLVSKVNATYKKSENYTFVNFGFEVL